MDEKRERRGGGGGGSTTAREIAKEARVERWVKGLRG